MKITHNKIGQNLNLKDSGSIDKANQANSKLGNLPNVGEAKTGAGSDASAKLELSPRAQEMKKIKEAATSAPDVDMAKVEKFRRMIDDGTYKVDAKAVASKMIDEEIEMAGLSEASE